MDNNDFLIQLDTEPNFYTQTVNGKLAGSPYPNCALHMPYDVADRRCQEFRELGYDAAMVTNRYGQPVTASDLAAMKLLEYQISFSKHYFTGISSTGALMGSRTRDLAKNLSHIEAQEICRQLKKAGHIDACVVEVVKNH